MPKLPLPPTTQEVLFSLIVLAWGLYSSYKIRKLATIGRWEAALLYGFYCSFFVVSGYLVGYNLVWVGMPIIFAWFLSVYLSPRTVRYGCLAEKGYLRSVIVGQKHGQIVRSPDDLSAINALVIEPIFLSSADTMSMETKTLLQAAIRKKIRVLDVVQFLNDEYGFSEIQHHQNKIDLRTDYAFDLVKLIVEKFLAFFMLLLLSPVFCLVTIVILALEGRPIFFRQSRLGKGGKPFEIWKFRTMDITDIQERPFSTFGAFLRNSHIDELPQIWNVLRGEMALLGPRPEWRDWAIGESAPNEYWMRTTVRPGITGWAQTIYKPSRNRRMRQRKLGHDVFYINNRGLFLDALIWLRTAQKLVLFVFQKNTLH